MKLAFGIAAFVVSGALASAAVAQSSTKEIKVEGGIIKVSITPIGTTAATGPKQSPRVGVAGYGLFAAPLARKLDEAGVAQVVSPSKFSVDAASFDTVTKSEFAETLTTACRKSKVDYALYMAQPQISSGMSTSAYVFGFGRMRQTRSFEVRLYDCKTGQPAWDATVAVESSSGIWTNMFMGKTAGGGSQSQDAAAQVIADRLVADTGFVKGSGQPEAAPPEPPSTSLVAVTPAPDSGTLVMAKPGHLYRGPSAKSAVQKTLASGALLYPTGGRQGVWEEVTDEEGTKGWVSSQLATAFHDTSH